LGLEEPARLFGETLVEENKIHRVLTDLAKRKVNQAAAALVAIRMEDGMSTAKKVPEGERPEALTTFEAAARSGGKKPAGQGLTAQPETASRPDDPARKDKTATKVLRAGVAHDPEAMTDAVQNSKDPRIP